MSCNSSLWNIALVDPWQIEHFRPGGNVNHSSDLMDIFLNDITEKIPPTQTEELELVRRIKLGDIDARNELVNCHMRFVIKYAKQYQNRGLLLPDLIQEASQGMIRAAEKYDPSYGAKLISYSTWWMRQKILAAIERQGRMVRQPLLVMLKRGKIKKFRDSYFTRYGRNPSYGELAEKFSITERDVDVYLSGDMVSFDSVFPTSTGEGKTLYQILPDTGDAPDEALARADQVSKIITRIEELQSLGRISAREKEIFLLRVGYYHDGEYQTLESIAVQYSLTRERIRQIFEKAQLKLRRSFKSEPHRWGVPG